MQGRKRSPILQESIRQGARPSSELSGETLNLKHIFLKRRLVTLDLIKGAIAFVSSSEDRR